MTHSAVRLTLGPRALGAMLAAHGPGKRALNWPGGTGAARQERRRRSRSRRCAPGVDYTLPTEAEIKAVLDRVRDPLRALDAATA